MNLPIKLNRLLSIVQPVLAAALAHSTFAAPVLQYGFDFTTGTVASNGGSITDDSGNGNHGTLINVGRGNGGTYSSDIPTVNVQNVTGISSLDITGGNALSTSPTAGSTFSGEALVGATAADVDAAGGLTYELWVKNVSNASSGGHLLVLGGMHGIAVHATAGVGFIYGDDTSFLTPATAIDTTTWTHIAVTMASTTVNTHPGEMTFSNISLYENGVKVAEDADGHTFGFGFLERALGVGKHGVFDGDDANGLIYEPRVSLGVLDSSQFTYQSTPGGGISAPASVGGNSDGTTVQLTIPVGNTAASAVTLTSTPTLAGANAGDFEVSSHPASVPGGGDADILVDFTPSSGDGLYAATLTINSDDATNPVLAVALAVDVRAPAIVIDPILDFGNFANVPAATSDTISVQNMGGASLLLGNPQFTGAGAAAYGMVSLPASVAPGASTTIEVGFDPGVGGSFPAQLTLTTNDPRNPTVTVNLAGAVGQAGGLPTLVFQPRPAKAALMSVGCHPDDEGIFLGGTITYYAQVRKVPVVHILMTDGAGGQNHRTQDGSDFANTMVTQDGETIYLREGEMYNTARVYGLPSKPVLAGFGDGASGSWWNSSSPETSAGVIFMVEQIRLYQPDVIVTHAFNGEYGSRDHVATTNVVSEAFDLAADGSYRPDLGATWEVKKLYVHANSSNGVLLGPKTMDHSWEERFGVLDLSNTTVGFDGDLGFFVNTDLIVDGSSRDIAKQGLRQHASQSPGFWTLLDSDPGNDSSPGYTRVESIHESGDRDNNPSEWWNLFKERIGPDSRARDDFLENIDLRPYDATVIAHFGMSGGDGTSVVSAGDEVISQCGGTAGAHAVAGDGGTFSSDRPVQRVRNAVGSVSLDLSSGALSTGGTGEGGSTTFGDIRANGGLTLEAWIKGAGSGTGTNKILSVAGAFNLDLSNGVLRAANGFGGTAAVSSTSLTDWVHAAAVFRVSGSDAGSGSPLVMDLELYVNGILMDVATGSIFTDDLDRGIGIGDHPLAIGERYEGLVYDPVVSLGARSGSDFETVLPASTNAEHVQDLLTRFGGPFAGQSDPAVIGFDANADGDGLANIFELWRGTDPASADSPVALAYGETGAGAATVQVTVDPAVDDLLNIDVQTSFDLVTWRAITANRAVVSDDGFTRVLEFTDLAAMPLGGSAFFVRFAADLGE